MLLFVFWFSFVVNGIVTTPLSDSLIVMERRGRGERLFSVMNYG